MTEPIQSLEVENYGCIKKQTFHLSGLHCFVGPNDSGKSTVLRAARVAAQFAGGRFTGGVGTGPHEPFDPMFEPQGGTSITVNYADGFGYQLQTERVRDSLAVNERPFSRQWEITLVKRSWIRSSPILKEARAGKLVRRLTPATMVRFDPNALRRPSPQILSGQPIQFADETGVGLASVYQAINGQDVDAFVAIRDRARQFFPTLKTIQMLPEAEGMVGLRAKLFDDKEVPAAALSEGLLYFLGFAALQHLQGTRLILVEEPENGLHPSRIAEVMAILREISKTSQVLIASHSPLVVNELQGDEVTVVTRTPEAGTVGTLLKDVPGFDQAMEVYAPGEFWLSYADGKQEEALLQGKPRG